MLGFEVGEVLGILLVRVGFLVCGQLYVVPLFGRVGLGFVWLFAFRVQLLPSVADELGDLSERQVLILDLFTYPVREDHVCRWRPLRRIFVRLGVSTVLSLGLDSNTRKQPTSRLGPFDRGAPLSDTLMSRASVQALEGNPTILRDRPLEFLFSGQSIFTPGSTAPTLLWPSLTFSWSLQPLISRPRSLRAGYPQVTLLYVQYRLPRLEAFVVQGIEVVVQAQAVQMRGEICHSCRRLGNH